MIVTLHSSNCRRAPAAKVCHNGQMAASCSTVGHAHCSVRTAPLSYHLLSSSLLSLLLCHKPLVPTCFILK